MSAHQPIPLKGKQLRYRYEAGTEKRTSMLNCKQRVCGSPGLSAGGRLRPPSGPASPAMAVWVGRSCPTELQDIVDGAGVVLLLSLLRLRPQKPRNSRQRVTYSTTPAIL